MRKRWWTAQVKLPWLDHPMAFGPFGVTVYPGETHTATASFPSGPEGEWMVHGQCLKVEWLEFISGKILFEDRTGFFEQVFRQESNVVEIRREK